MTSVLNEHFWQMFPRSFHDWIISPSLIQYLLFLGHDICHHGIHNVLNYGLLQAEGVNITTERGGGSGLKLGSGGFIFIKALPTSTAQPLGSYFRIIVQFMQNNCHLFFYTQVTCLYSKSDLQLIPQSHCEAVAVLPLLFPISAV